MNRFGLVVRATSANTAKPAITSKNIGRMENRFAHKVSADGRSNEPHEKNRGPKLKDCRGAEPGSPQDCAACRCCGNSPNKIPIISVATCSESR
jgi:hypothetical protein